MLLEGLERGSERAAQDLDGRRPVEGPVVCPHRLRDGASRWAAGASGRGSGSFASRATSAIAAFIAERDSFFPIACTLRLATPARWFGEQCGVAHLNAVESQCGSAARPVFAMLSGLVWAPGPP